MQYVLLIYLAEQYVDSLDAAERASYYQGFADFSDALERSGTLLASQGLQPSATATSVRIRDGKPLLTDGPFAETREQLGGVFVLDVKDLDAAIEIARSVPAQEHIVVEVRPALDCKVVARAS